MKLIHINAVKESISDWQAPYEVAETLKIEVKEAEGILKSLVRMGRAKHVAQNNTYKSL